MAVETNIAVIEPFYARAGRAILNFFESVAEANSLVREIKAVENMSDADLANRGLDRAEAIRRIVIRRSYI